MRLIKAGAAALLMAGLCVLPAAAYDYPVVGEYNNNYQKVFDGIKAGNCASMDADLAALESSEGISPDIYRAICYFENNNSDKGFETVSGMLTKQDYDEALYVTSAYAKKNPSDSRSNKYFGIIHLNIGDVNDAVGELTTYLNNKEDAEARYALVDVYLIMKRYDDAEKVLDKSAVKDGGYYLRKARIQVNTGKSSDAIASLDKVSSTDKDYASAVQLKGDICAVSGRFLCAKESIAALKGTEFEKFMPEKLEKLEKLQRPFSAYISLGEEFDNNVTAVDEDEIAGVSEEESFRTSIVADVKYNMYPSKFFDRLSIGMLNYKSWNHSIQSYDMASHKLYVQGRRSIGALSVVPRVSAGQIVFDGRKYSDSLGIDSTFSYKYGEYTFSLPLFLDVKNYFADTSAGDNDKDGTYYGGSFKVSREFMKKYTLGVSTGYDIEAAEGKEKKAANSKFGIEAGAKISDKLSLTATYDYTDTDYKDSSDNRNDGYYTAGIRGMYRFTGSVFVTVGAAYSENDSNNNRYDYQKTVISTAVGYMY